MYDNVNHFDTEDEAKLFKALVKKLNGKIIKEKAEHIPNKLTAKVIEDARNNKGLDKPIKNIKAFIASL